MNKIFFLIPPFYSHFSPMFTLAKAFREAGWRVVVGTGESFEEEVREADLSFVSVEISRNANTGIASATQQAGEERERLEAFFQATFQGPEETLILQSRHRQADMLADPQGLMNQITQLNQQDPPDLWVVDQLSYGATLSLTALALPFITVCPPHPFSIPPEDGLFGVPLRWPSPIQPNPAKLKDLETTAAQARRLFTDVFNATLIRCGQKPVKNAFSLASTRGIIYNYPPTPAVTARHNLSAPPAIFAGYAFSPQRLSLLWEDKLSSFTGGSPRILLSLGTFLSRRWDVLEKVIEWIRRAFPASSLVVAAGDSLENLKHLQEPRVLVERFLPQTALYPEVDLVIHHGGCNTFTESLYHGKPMVILPFSSDQFHIAADGEDMGVARVLDPNRMTKEELVRSVEQLLSWETEAHTRHWQHVLRGRGPSFAVKEILQQWQGEDWR